LYEFYENKRIIQAHEVDFTNRLRIDSLFIHLQDTAAAHADSLNLGYSALVKHDLGWVLSWAKVEIISFPEFGNEIRIRTWPKKKFKLYSLRDFYIYDEKGQIIIRATTAWLPINIKSKRIIDISRLPAPINYQETESAINELPHKIQAQNNRTFIFSRHMRYTDLDLNQHVNNIRYIELILDSFPKEQYKKFKMENISINFVSESGYNDELEIYKSNDSGIKEDIIESINKVNSKTVFHAVINWKEV
jgi:medium-chain acyl-[acyl-carrier-protein] hydrolase